MSNYPSSKSLKPLSVGNVVTAAIQLFRSHFKQYLGLTLKSYLWVLVPLYGWAKFLMIHAMISRLAFGDLIGRPESEKEARSQLEDKKWGFLGLAFLVGLISGGVVIAFYFALIILVLIGVAIVAVVGQDNIAVLVILGILGVLAFAIFIVAMTWFYSRLMISELPFAIESVSNAASSVGRSWELTKGYVLRIQGIVIVAFLMTLPLQIITQALAFIFQIFLARFFSEDSAAFLAISLLGSYFIGAASSLFVVPFWQSIKAVIYYDVRNRTEGLDLEIRDRPLA
jgi:hypothetical protein